MSSRFWLLGVESCDFSQAEKEGTACKVGKIHNMTTIFTQNNNLWLGTWVKIIVILWICSALHAVLSFSAWKKITWLNSQQPKTRGHVEHPIILLAKYLHANLYFVYRANIGISEAFISMLWFFWYLKYNLPSACHYKPRLVYFSVRFIIKSG